MKRCAILTAESVTEGHPDKLADQISDAIVDSALSIDRNARVACETLVTNNQIVVAGEMKGEFVLDIEQIVRGVLRNVGYSNNESGIDCDKCSVISRINLQSDECSDLIDRDLAGDQVVVAGYAVDESPSYMPLPIFLANKMAQRLATVRKDGTLPYLKPDGKVLISIKYSENFPAIITNIVISPQHKEYIDKGKLKKDLIEHVVNYVIPKALIGSETKYFFNELETFIIGGPMADSGVTGRKLASDTYGPAIPHGGGAFSGKDPTKLDRTGSYMARYIAKNIVASGLSKKCLVELVYIKGVREPVVFSVETQCKEDLDENLEKFLLENIDFTTKGIIERLQLDQPIYGKTAAYGHFGREDVGFRWEDLDLSAVLKETVIG